jgi:1,4-dihydroxy-6-naphthoate synthase
MELSFAYSPCPNDTFTFGGIAARHVTLPPHAITVCHHDIETLNQAALCGRYAITKLSFHTWLLCQDRYRLLSAGNALGHNCGPVLVARQPVLPEALAGLRIVLPGEHTTAHLLLRLYCPTAQNRLFTTYDRIFAEILAGRAEAGVVIHEGRFRYAQAGLQRVCDLGQWWEETTHTPIPLGAIAVRNDVPPELDAALADLIRRSLRLAQANPGLVWDEVRRRACEQDEAVLHQQIAAFVTDYTMELGERGLAAIAQLRQRARAAGVVS